ncbi:SGNH hydrolase-type esterase domain-containing protein [Xylariaceae sp. FL0662B]|nr:SGNH hydrolase-type esterase domain-containing protein [Xylariaceae sp. FL0662B]
MVSRILLLQSFLIAYSNIQSLVHAASIGYHVSAPDERRGILPAAIDMASRDTQPFYLRILPLGASITWGLLSSDGNGYRGPLREQLRLEGWPVNMVGTLTHGKMKDNNNEGHSGWRVDQISNVVGKVTPQKPNLILINAGTNDCTQNYHINDISTRMNGMLDHLFKDISNTTVILSTLLPNKKEKTNSCVQVVNKRYRDIVSARQAKKQKIVLAEMDDGFMTTKNLKDSTHPTDEGYKMMASVWVSAIHDAEKRKFLTAPEDTGVADDAVPLSSKSSCGDPKYIHESENKKRIFEPGTTKRPEDFYRRVSFAQLVNVFASKDRIAELDELIWDVLPGHPDYAPGYHIFMNNDGKYGPITKIDTKGYCKSETGASLNWGDVDGDGLADYICIGPAGNMYVSINKGGNPPKFDYIGMVKKGPTGVKQSNILLGDIDGDGRIDYCVLASNGDLSCYRNNIRDYAKTKDFERIWTRIGKNPIFKYKGGDVSGVRLLDFDGDGRADFLTLSDTGNVTTWLNTPGKDTLIPTWKDAGITHEGTGVNGSRDTVKFGRVFASGRLDYIKVESDKDGDRYKNYIHVWKNTKFQAEECNNGNNNDDGVVTDPKLPAYKPHVTTREAPS